MEYFWRLVTNNTRKIFLTIIFHKKPNPRIFGVKEE